ncbi:MAG: hypothetical protein H6708_13890 [Kofleriaceae bacterium]|nr:hypothetical protein [Kofleriaceae bacterium]
MPAALLAALGVAPATGCSFDHAGVDMTIDAAGGDDSPDAPPAPDATDVPDAAPPDAACGGMALTFTPANVDACAIPPSQGDFTFPDAKVTIDTTAGTVRTPGGPLAVAHAIVTQTDGATEAMVISADDLTVPAGVDVVVTGSRPLIVVALGTMDVAGTLDAGGTMGVAGPGGDLACATGAGAAGVTQVDADGHTGATGGSGGARGTDGGGGAYVSPVTNNPQMITGGQAWAC